MKPALAESEADPRDFSLPERLLLRVAALHRPDVVAPGERVLYATIGLLLCFFFLYSCVALYAFFERVGVTEIGGGATGAILAGAGAATVAAVLVAFDRSIVAQINPRLKTLEPAGARSDAAVPSREYLHPAGDVTLKPFIGRFLIALLIGFFTTQAVEVVVFSDDIVIQQVKERRARVERELERSRSAQRVAQAQYERDRTGLQEGIRDAEESAKRAQLGQKRLGCKADTECRKRRARAAELQDRLEGLGPSPTDPGSEYAKRQAKLLAQLDALDKRPEEAVRNSQGALEDIAALYRFLGDNREALIYFVGLALILLSLDLAPLLLKYFVARGTEYDRRQATRQRARWRETAAAAQREDEVRRLAADAEAAAYRSEQLTLRRGYEEAERDPDVLHAARLRTRDVLLDRVSTAPPPAAVPPAAAGAPGPDRGVVTATDAGGSGAAGRESDRVLTLEILGVVAGFTAVVYLFGGVFHLQQLDDAGLPFDAFHAIPTRTLFVRGAEIALIGLPLIGGLILMFERLLSRTQRTMGVTDDYVGWTLRDSIALLRAAPGVLIAGIRATFSSSGRHPADTPTPVVAGGATAAVSVLAAGGATDSLLGAAVAGATGLGTTVLTFVIVGVLGWIDPRSRRFRAVALLCIALGTAFGADWWARQRPMELATATVRPPDGARCLRGPLLGQQGATANLVDGVTGALRVVPVREGSGVVIAPERRPVAGAAIQSVRCPAALTGG